MFQNSELIQGVVALAILAMVGWQVRRNGQMNPKSTGEIEHDVNTIKMKMQSLDTLPKQMRDAKKSNDAKFTALEEQVGKVDSEVTMLKERVDHLATKEDVGRVNEAIKFIVERSKATDESVVRIEQHLLGNSRGRGR